MRRSPVLRVIYVWGLGLPLLLAGCGPMPEAKLSLLGSSHADLGNLLQFEARDHSFVFQNTGNIPIVLDRIQSSCGCTQVKADREFLEPGQKAVCTATLNAQDRVGSFASTIRVYWKSEDGARQGCEDFTLEGNAVRMAVLEPSFLDFGKVDADLKSISQMVAVKKGDSQKDWDGLEILFNGERLPVKKDPDAFRTCLTFTPAAFPLGNFKSELRIRFRRDGNYLDEELKIPVNALITSDVAASPPSLFFGVLYDGAAKEGQIQIKSKTGAPVFLQSISTDNPETLQVSKVPDEAGAPLRIAYRFSPKGKKGDISTKLKVAVSINHKTRYLEIPALCYIKASSAETD
jgi:hypothetical protein